jgi:cytochrome c2
MMARAPKSFRTRLLGLMTVVGLAVALTACASSIGSPIYSIAGANPDNGPSLLNKYGCIACHTIPGVRGANANVGPPLTHWSKRAYIAGEAPNVPDNLIKWIENPQSIEPNTVMPNLGVTDPDARDIAAYLYSIK